MQSDIALGIAGGIIAMALGAIGSGLGTGAAAASAIGAWKRCYAQGKQAPFILLSYVGAPITQTLYGMILMTSMKDVATSPDLIPGSGLAMLVIGIFAGLALGISAWMQGRAGAAAADAQGVTGSGLSNNLSALGIVETVAIFAMVFTYITVGELKVDKSAPLELPAAPVATAVAE